MFTTAEVLIIFAAVAGSGSMVGLLAWIHGRLRKLDELNSQLRDDSRRLAEEIESVRDELGTAHDHIVRLSERAEFTERLLTEERGSAGRKLPEPTNRLPPTE